MREVALSTVSQFRHTDIARHGAGSTQR